jgi:hypothetical protein
MKLPFSRTIKNWWNIRFFNSKGWKFSDCRKSMCLTEVDEWKKYYLPIDVKGLTVLDAGAGEGETAKFFLEHGAKKVICIEPDAQSFHNLADNALRHPITPINRKFQLSDLDLDCDFMKIDIEGYEEELLDVDIKKPVVLEVHGLQLRDKFRAKGYSIAESDYSGKNFSCLSFAYKNIRNKR